MNDELEPLLRSLPPKTFQALQRAIVRYGERRGQTGDWVQRWIGFIAVGDALSRYGNGRASGFEIKGGAAIEMRLQDEAATQNRTPGLRPRATKDLDVAFRGDRSDIEKCVAEALATATEPFVCRAEIEHRGDRAVRFRVRIGFVSNHLGRAQERNLCSVKLEVSSYEGTPLPPDEVRVLSLRPFGFDGPAMLPCLTLPKQIAQKLHAMTAPPAEGRTNDRFRDLVDLVLLSGMTPASPELKACCVEIFGLRATHSWPPTIRIYEHWREPAQRLAAEVGLEIETTEELEAHVNEYLGAIDGQGDHRAPSDLHPLPPGFEDSPGVVG